MRRFKITLSVEVRIVNPRLFFPVIYVCFSLNFNAYTFGHCLFFSGTRSPPTSPPMIPLIH